LNPPPPPPRNFAAHQQDHQLSEALARVSGGGAAAPPSPSVNKLVSDLVHNGRYTEAAAVIAGHTKALDDGEAWINFTEEERIQKELSNWTWTWDKDNNIRFEWNDIPLSKSREIWRTIFYKCYAWTVSNGGLELKKTPLGEASEKYARYPQSYPAPVKQRIK